MPQARKDSEEKPTAADVGSERKVEAPAEDESSPVFTVEQLTTGSGVPLVGPVHVAAGAFAGVAPSKEVTVKDAKARVKEWLRSPVEQPSQE